MDGHTHQQFCEILERHQIRYNILSSTTTRIEERVDFVLTKAGVLSDIREVE